MSQVEPTTKNVKPSFHPVSHYDTPDDVVNDAKLSTDEKRVILSSWASDMYVVESQPTLREIPGLPNRLRLSDILAALKQLDDDIDPPPRGGMAMRLPRLGVLNEAIYESPQLCIDGQTSKTQHRSIQAFRTSNHRRWTREENIRRYRKLLNTQLTGLERSFVERRLAEELRGRPARSASSPC
jgi:hypothetical protein